MFVCAKCNRVMKIKKNGVPFIEMMSTDRPYKLWSADLWECPVCEQEMLHTSQHQQPIAEHYQDDFVERVASYAPQYQANWK